MPIETAQSGGRESLADPQMHAMVRRDTQLSPPPQGTVLLGRPSMPRASLHVRVKTSPLLRAALPTPILVARAEAKADRLWNARGETRAQALRAMRAVVAGTPMEREIEELARRHIVENAAWNALFWRRWPRAVPTEERCRERLLAACSQGRGVVLSACHIGPQFMTATLLVSL